MPTEIRYLRSDQATVNGLLAYIFNTVETAATLYSDVTGMLYLGIEAFLRHADGSETCFSGTVPVAQVAVPGSTTNVRGAWTPPLTSCVPTDTVVIRVYGTTDGTTWSLLATSGGVNCEFQTEQLGAYHINAVVWGVYYYFVHTVIYDRFEFGSTAQQSRTENFAWDTVPPAAANPAGDGLVAQG